MEKVTSRSAKLTVVSNSYHTLFFRIWESVVDRMMRQCTNIHESQLGFMPGRNTTYAIFILKQAIEKHRAGQKNIGVIFIDLEKA